MTCFTDVCQATLAAADSRFFWHVTGDVGSWRHAGVGTYVAQHDGLCGCADRGHGSGHGAAPENHQTTQQKGLLCRWVMSKQLNMHLKNILAILGLEPRTFALLARRSNQLSYTAWLAKLADLCKNDFDCRFANLSLKLITWLWVVKIARASTSVDEYGRIETNGKNTTVKHAAVRYVRRNSLQSCHHARTSVGMSKA